MEKGGVGRPGLARLEPGDGDRLRRFFYRLSRESVYRRFLSPIARPEQLAPQHLLDLDGRARAAVVAEVGGEIIGVARYAADPTRPGLADLAVVVADAWQDRGLGIRLLGALGDLAGRAGYEGFSVVTLPDNLAAIRLLRHFAPDLRLSFRGGVLEGSLPLVAA